MDQGNLIKEFNEAAFTFKEDVVGTVDYFSREKYHFEWNVISPYHDVPQRIFNGDQFDRVKWQRDQDRRATVSLDVFRKDGIRGYTPEITFKRCQDPPRIEIRGNNLNDEELSHVIDLVKSEFLAVREVRTD